MQIYSRKRTISPKIVSFSAGKSTFPSRPYFWFYVDGNNMSFDTRSSWKSWPDFGPTQHFR